MAKRRQDPYYHRGEPGMGSKLLKIFGVVAIIALILGGTWAMTLMQPKKTSWRDFDTPVAAIPPAVMALHDKSLDLEHTFREAEKTGKDITPADLDTLRQALQLENDYVTQANLGEKGSERLVALTSTLETYEAKHLFDECTDFKNKAAELEKTNDIDGARKLYSQAIQRERQIERYFPHSTYYQATNESIALLQLKVDELTAMPLREQSDQAETNAKDAVKRQDWQTALDQYRIALDLQQRINREYPGQTYANASRSQDLGNQVTSLEAYPDHLKVIQLTDQAKAAEAAGDLAPSDEAGKDYAKAAELYQEAERQQDQLAARYPKSIFATDAAFRVKLEDERQAANSWPVANEIITRATSLFDDLRNRRVDKAAETIGVLKQQAEKFHSTFPHSPLISDELQNRLDYLDYMHASLAEIQQQVLGQLQALPGDPRHLMAKQEVTQQLYELIKGSKPSRHIGPDLPVESVNWSDAKDFCQKLSWILERPVRLPTVDEFRLAVGSTDKLDAGAASWNADNSSGQTQTVATKTANSNGFYDLLGNVAEWLERSGDLDDGSALVAGGSAQTPVDAIRTVPVTSLDLTNRNPFTGFRFVVDTDDTAPLLPSKTTTAKSAATGSP